MYLKITQLTTTISSLTPAVLLYFRVWGLMWSTPLFHGVLTDIYCVHVLFRFALGDARRPLYETAALVEDIVHAQLIAMVTYTWLTAWQSVDFGMMAWLFQTVAEQYWFFGCDGFIYQLHQACEGAALRGSRVISAEDILFLMRRDKVQSTPKIHSELKRYKVIKVKMEKLPSYSFVSASTRERWQDY